MPFQIGVNIGFVTNSSSMVYHFPKSLLEHPDVKALVEAFEIQSTIGSDLWNRGECTTIAYSAEEKQEVRDRLAEMEDARLPGISDDDNTFVVIFGDEYSGLVPTFAHLLKQTADALGLTYGSDEYN